MGRLHEVRLNGDPKGLEFYPTQPWATRALMDQLGLARGTKVLEPACGGGHMSAVLKEYGMRVMSSDVEDWGYPGTAVEDFLGPEPRLYSHQWVITNPPYGKDRAEKFALQSFKCSTEGVAILSRSNWFEGAGRYRRLWKDNPPSRVYVFSERLGFARETCVVGRGGLTAYSWFVWLQGEHDTRVHWIPPGTKARLSKATDSFRFGGRTALDPEFP